jgi:hypothetical protein
MVSLKTEFYFLTEFSLEIPDEAADQITTVAEAIEYISKSAEGSFLFSPIFRDMNSKFISFA